VFAYVELPVERQFHFIFNHSAGMIYPIMLSLVAAGSLIGLSASYFSTRKMINDA
jgi:hypothetical protein